jgi:hypothetical protein
MMLANIKLLPTESIGCITGNIMKHLIKNKKMYMKCLATTMNYLKDKQINPSPYFPCKINLSPFKRQ